MFNKCSPLLLLTCVAGHCAKGVRLSDTILNLRNVGYESLYLFLLAAGLFLVKRLLITTSIYLGVMGFLWEFT